MEATACSKPPAGRARWTLVLLAGELVKLTAHDSLSRETVRQRLAENDLKPWRKDMWCIPQIDAEAVKKHARHAVRIGIESGQLSTWLYHGLKERGLPVICIDARHARAALSLKINKTDDNDAEGVGRSCGSVGIEKSP
jgi:transposase